MTERRPKHAKLTTQSGIINQAQNRTAIVAIQYGGRIYLLINVINN